MGVTLIEQTIDFKNKLFYQYIGSINYCKKFEIPYEVDLDEETKKMMDPKNGFFKYLGETTVAWADGAFYQF